MANKSASPETRVSVTGSIRQICGEGGSLPTLGQLGDRKAFGSLGSLLYRDYSINYIHVGNPVITQEIFLEGYGGIIFRHTPTLKRSRRSIFYYPFSEEDLLREFISRRRKDFE